MIDKCKICGKPNIKLPNGRMEISSKGLCRNCYSIYRRTGSFERKWYSKHISKGGYYRILIKGTTGRVLEHRYIMEQHLGRKLDPLEKIHHINGNKLDNRVENMKILTQSEHMSNFHESPNKRYSDETIKAIFDIANTKPKTPTCLFPNCTNKRVGRGLCRKHYSRYEYYNRNK